MILYQPQLSIFKGNDDNYYLQAISFADRIDLRTNGQKVRSKPNKKGILKIELYAQQEENLSDIKTKCLNPIVHFMNIGADLDEVKDIQVSLYIIEATPKNGTASSRSTEPEKKKAGSTTSGSPTTIMISRPKPKTKT